MPNIKVANPDFNVNEIREELLKASQLGINFVVLPKLIITGANLQDLIKDRNVLNSARNALFSLISLSVELDIVIVASLPLEYNNNVYETAAVIKSGELLGLVPKNDNISIDNISLIDQDRNISFTTPFDKNIVFNNERFDFSVKFDSDFSGAKTKLYANIVSIPETVDVDKAIIKLKSISENSNSIIITSSSGPSESSVSNAYFGRSSICECGDIVTKNDILTNHIIYADVDLDKVNALKQNNNKEDKTINAKFIYNNFMTSLPNDKLNHEFDTTPYINKSINPYRYSSHILNILAVALAKRMNAMKAENIVLGISGGLDSTIALLIAKKTVEFLGLSTQNIKAYSMPGFGTTNTSQKNLIELASSIQVTINTINISNAVNEHFIDISHDPANTNVTYENSQARERTQILMDIANDCNGLVLGTGDLSEIALGFSTYNGDHMSMYNINGSLPKTLIKYILNAIAEESINTNNNILLANTLKNIINAPISPELKPLVNGTLTQKTEEIVGNYEIHDFILYYYLKYNYDSHKLYDLALRTFVYNNGNKYTDEYVKHVINMFFNRFYKAAFKRSTSPDSPSIGLPNLDKFNSFSMPNDSELDVTI